MPQPHKRSVFTRACKECGTRFPATADTIDADVARGLSEPARCPKCRKEHGRYINAVGSGYFSEQRRSIPHPRCQGKFGLGMLEHPEPERVERSYELTPTPEQLEKFRILDPAVQKLIANLEDPRGTKVSILVGPTGTGKSVWAPTQILRSSIGKEGRICVTQPRLVTLRTSKGKGDDATTPGFVAKSLLGADAVGAGQEVGLLYSGESTKSDRYTRLLYVTDGILIRWILSGQLGRFSVIMIDEAHEQSANMELIFALLRYHLPLYPRLRLVIMSATMDLDRFVDFFGNGDPKRVFVAKPDEPATLCKIHDRWPDGDNGYLTALKGMAMPTDAKECPKAIAEVVRAIRQTKGFTQLGNPNGDILCFVPTVRLVEETVNAVSSLSLPNLEVLSCYAKMEDEEIEALQRSEIRAGKAKEAGVNTSPQRVIIATNYAETSVTFANLRYVIDSGFIMEPVWDPITCSMDYPVRRHSQAGCTQRKGRVGRVQDGEVFRLYIEADFNNPTIFPKNPRPAIAREPLEKFLLAAKAAGVANLDEFNWLGFDKQDGLQSGERERSLSALKRHGVVDVDGDITHRGLELEGVRHASLDWSRAMSESDGMGCALEMGTFLAFTELQRQPFIPGEVGLLAYLRWSIGCADDLEFYLRLFHHWSKAGESRTPEQHSEWSKSEGLNHKAFREISKGRRAALEEFTERTHTDPTARALDLARVERVRLVMLRVLHPWVYVRSPEKDGSFVPLNPDICPCKAKVWIDQDSACDTAESLQAFLCVDRRTLGDRVLASHIVRINPAWLEGVRTGSTVAVALLASRSRDAQGNQWENGAMDRILATAATVSPLSEYREGQARSFFVRRFKKGDKRHLVLATDTANKKPLIFSFEGGILRKGDTVRGHVDKVAEGNLLPIHQRSVVASYTEGSILRQHSTRVIKELREPGQDDGPITAQLLELEPGVTAMVRRHPDERFWFWWREYLSGRCPMLKVLKNTGRIMLGLHFPEPEVGDEYHGVVKELKYSHQTQRFTGLLVQFLPNKTGMVFWKTAARGVLEAYNPGDTVWVRIISTSTTDDGYVRYDLELSYPHIWSR